MQTIATPELQAITDILAATANPELIVLFGSRAKGKETADSDIDLLVVESEPFGPARSRRDEIARLTIAVKGKGGPKDILVYSREEVEKYRAWPNHVVREALTNGVVLYERQA